MAFEYFWLFPLFVVLKSINLIIKSDNLSLEFLIFYFINLMVLAFIWHIILFDAAFSQLGLL